MERSDGVANLDVAVVPDPDGPTVVRVSGEIDVATAPKLRDSLAGVDGDVVVDLSGVTFMDSTALGALVAAASRTRDAGFTFSVQGQSEFVGRLLNVAGLSEFFRSNGERES